MDEDISSVRSKKSIILLLATFSTFDEVQGKEDLKKSSIIYRYPGSCSNVKENARLASNPSVDAPSMSTKERQRKSWLMACHICREACYNWPDYLVHMKHHFPDQLPIHCHLCQMRFQSFVLFLNHHRIHTSKKAYIPVKSSANKEKSATKKDAQCRFPCTLCPFKTRWHSTLVRHMRRHFPDQRHYHCPVCRVSFHGHNDLYRHRRSEKHAHAVATSFPHKEMLPERLNCQHCLYSTMLKDSLTKHISVCNPEQNKLLPPGASCETIKRRRSVKTTATSTIAERVVVIPPPPPLQPSVSMAAQSSFHPLLRTLLTPKGRSVTLPVKPYRVLSGSHWSDTSGGKNATGRHNRTTLDIIDLTPI